MPDTVMTNMEAPQPMAASYQRRSAEFEKLAAALAKAQGAMENAKKDSENPAFKRGDKISKYADLASVWDAIRKPLADNGLAVMQWPRTVDKGVEIETELLHESGQFMRDTLWLPCPTMTVHSIGSTITYGRRYALMSIAGIAPEDDDGNAAVEAHKPGAAGSAGAGTDFRPPGPRKFTGRSWTDDDPQLVDTTREKGKLPAKAAGPLGGREATAEEAITLKIKNAVNKRIDALKAGSPWTRDGLDQFWKADKKWIDWMSDPNNKQLVEYGRFTDAFADAEVNSRPVELA